MEARGVVNLVKANDGNVTRNLERARASGFRNTDHGDVVDGEQCRGRLG